MKERGEIFFETCLVGKNPDKSVQVVMILVIIGVAGLFIAGAAGWDDAVAWIFGGIVLLVIVFAVIKKGRIQGIIVTNKRLKVTPEQIIIDGTTYETRKLKQLHFCVHSFAGMNLGGRR